MIGKITDVKAIKVYDSRGSETIKVTVTGDRFLGTFTVPKGASKGMKEGIELPVDEAINRIDTLIKPAIIGLNYFDQAYLDKTLLRLDNTPNLSHLGANAILGVSLATARLASHESGQVLYRYLGGINDFIFPIPMLNFLNGGMHSSSNLCFQEIMVVPFKFDSFPSAIAAGQKIYHVLKEMLRDRGESVAVGDEGGFAIDFDSSSMAIELLVEAIKKAGFTPGEDIYIAIDAAANSFYNYDSHRYEIDGSKLTGAEMIDLYEDLYNRYPIISIEDPFEETDYNNFHELYNRLGHKMMIVGDDLFVTDYKKIKDGYLRKLSNSVLIKPNQIGSLSMTFKAIDVADTLGMLYIISHRSGDNEDTFIADLALATRAPFIKSGSMSRSERVSKYNRLIELYEMIGGGEYFYEYLKDLDIFKNRRNSLPND